MTARLRGLLPLLCLALLGGCGGGSDGAKCVPGLTVACPCYTGQSGSQTCTAVGTYSACVCATPVLDAAGPGVTGGATSPPIPGGLGGQTSAVDGGAGVLGDVLGPVTSGPDVSLAVVDASEPSSADSASAPDLSVIDAPEFVAVCGDGLTTPPEACDDGNTISGDGCSSDCQGVDPGYICSVPGKPCTPKCGDGVIKPLEACDDGNTASGDGCSASCRVEPGFQCTGAPSTCERTICGNGIKEPGEGCDDGNTLPYDGCSPTCQVEPKCGTYDSAGNLTGVVGACQTGCGDGILLRGTEECDDGNLLDGDGCSHDCKIEKGWTCTSAYDNPPTSLTIPIVARDFQFYQDGTPPTGNPDFNHYCCDDSLTKGKGLIGSMLGTDRKPQWAGPTEDPLPNASQVLFTGQKEFYQWYHDVSGVNMTYYGSMILLQSAANQTTYAMNSDTDEPWYDLCGFYPLDDLTKPLIDQNTGQPVIYHYDQGQPDDRTCHAYQGLGFGNSWANHNYSFTTEQHYWFQYEGNENLEFTSDADAWVFINGTMAVEMPGTHNRAVAAVVLDASNGTAQVSYPNNLSLNTTVDLKLAIGNVYEVDVFHAERWCCGSNLMVTLPTFLAGSSECTPCSGDTCAAGSVGTGGTGGGLASGSGGAIGSGGSTGTRIVGVDAATSGKDSALYTPDVSPTCISQVVANGYACGTAAPCSACKDGSTSKQAECEAVIKCIEAAYPCTGNCATECFNKNGGNGPVQTCVTALQTAACGGSGC